MSAAPTFALRRAELTRRVESLPRELDDWKQRTLNVVDHNAHFSQVQAIDMLMQVFLGRQRRLLGQLGVAEDATAFGRKGWELVQEVIKAQRVWDYFRDKLNLRFVPEYQGPLWMADTVAWDCYRPVLEQATILGIVKKDELREPPLTYPTAEFSPATFVRDSSPPHEGRNN